MLNFTRFLPGSLPLKLIAMLELYLKRRGSDMCGSAVGRSAGVVVEGRGCVLNMRGRLTEQPLRDAATGDWLLWNGEVFGGKVQVRLFSCSFIITVLLRVNIYTDFIECVILLLSTVLYCYTNTVFHWSYRFLIVVMTLR